MHWIYLSPHLDDGVLSCGGMIWEQVQQGDEVQIWTICAGDPPEGDLSSFAQELHDRWGTGREASAKRREEDVRACQCVGAIAHHFTIPDCIYRVNPLTGQALITAEPDLNLPLDERDASTLQKVVDLLAAQLPGNVQVVSPMAIGSHVDHQLVRAAVERMNLPILYYADYPYVGRRVEQLEELRVASLRILSQPLSVVALQVWQDGAAEYASQISTFWGSTTEMRTAIADFFQRGGGTCLFELNKPFEH